MAIEYLESAIVFDNPRPHVRSRHGYHPGLARLGREEVIALFMVAEAFEAPNGTTYVARSLDGGRSWAVEGPLHSKPELGFETTDTMKPCVLRNGTLVASGYRFHRRDLEEGIAIPDSGGFQPGDNIVSYSRDGGRAWTAPAVIPRRYPELLELSGPCLETAAGDLVATAGYYNLPDGSNPTGKFGALLRSPDGGRSWDDSVLFLPSSEITPWETRICEMQPGRLVVLIWAYRQDLGRHLNNQVVVSHDNGATWSAPIDTGHPGQASSVCYLGGEYLLSIHAHRAADPGICVCLVDFTGDRWRVLEETFIWGRGQGPQTREGQPMAQMFASLRFGQPSLLPLGRGEFLASHWSIEEGQGRIRVHRLRVDRDRLAAGGRA